MTTPSSLWTFAIELYQAEEIKQNCLVFQDQYGQQVNQILALCWWAMQGWQLPPEEQCRVFNAPTLARHQELTQALRRARRQTKRLSLLDEQFLETYQQLKRTELGFERIELNCYEAQTLNVKERRNPGTALAYNLATYNLSQNTNPDHGDTHSVPPQNNPTQRSGESLKALSTLSFKDIATEILNLFSPFAENLLSSQEKKQFWKTLGKWPEPTSKSK